MLQVQNYGCSQWWSVTQTILARGYIYTEPTPDTVLHATHSEEAITDLSQHYGCLHHSHTTSYEVCIARAKRDGTRAETRFRLSPKRTSPFKSVGASVQSIAGSQGVRISLSNAGYTTFGGGVRVLATHSIRQFPLHFSSRASPCATRFRTSSTTTAGSEGVLWTVGNYEFRIVMLSSQNVEQSS